MRAQRHLLARLDRPGSPTHLALWRAVLAIHLIQVFTTPALPMLQRFHATPHRMAGTWFPGPLEAFIEGHLSTLVIVGLVSCLALLLGVFTRLAAMIVLVAFLGTQNYWFRSTVFHDDWLFMTFPLLVLCFARSGDVWSVDAWWAKRSGRERLLKDRRQYRWPVEAGVFWFGFVYVAAGLAKLLPLDKGIVWLTGVSTQEFAVQFMFESPLLSIFDTTPMDYTILWPFTVASVGTVLVELGVAWVWLSDRYRGLVIMAVLGMHLGIYFMGIPGFVQIAAISSVVLIPSHWFSDARRAVHSNS